MVGLSECQLEGIAKGRESGTCKRGGRALTAEPVAGLRARTPGETKTKSAAAFIAICNKIWCPLCRR